MHQETVENNALRRTRSITGLCIFLWIAAAGLAGVGVWIAIRGAVIYAGLAFAGGLLLAAAGLGLFRMRRWGVIAFAVFVMLGGVNYFSSALQDLLNTRGTALALSAVNLIVVVLFTLYMIYLVLLLWRNTK